jgi:hypothetical protein
MRGSGTVNTETIIGLMVGPGLGTLAAAALLEGFSVGDGAAFAFTAFLGGLYVYGATIPILAPITLALRYWRIDYILLFAAVGYAVGLIVFITAFNDDLPGFLRKPDIPSFLKLFQSGWDAFILFLPNPKIAALFTGPFTGAMVAIRLIAGPRT